jgi:chitodextrinase
MPLRRIAPILLLLLIAFPAVGRAQITWNSVRLTWTAVGDDSLTGRASQYDLRYSTSAITAANFASATQATGLPAPAASGTTEHFTVTGLQPGTTYWFAIKAADDAGNWSLISNVISAATSAAPDTVRPAPAVVAVTAISDTNATLGWTAVGDDSLSGTAASYEIRYSTSPITAANFAAAALVGNAPAPAAPGTHQSVVVHALARQATYYFAMRTSDEAGNVSALSNVATGTTTDTMPPAAIRTLAVGFVGISLDIELPLAAALRCWRS